MSGEKAKIRPRNFIWGIYSYGFEHIFPHFHPGSEKDSRSTWRFKNGPSILGWDEGNVKIKERGCSRQRR